MYRKVDENGIKSESGKKEMYRGIIGLRIASRNYLSGLSGEIATCLIFGVRTIGFACDSEKMYVNKKLVGNTMFDGMVAFYQAKKGISEIIEVENLPTKIIPAKQAKTLDDLIANAPVIDEGF
jgi:hypothetical protein